jgi:hypothetical protein
MSVTYHADAVVKVSITHDEVTTTYHLTTRRVSVYCEYDHGSTPDAKTLKELTFTFHYPEMRGLNVDAPVG